MTTDTKRLRELLTKATPGPWEACQKGDYGDFDGESRVLSNRDQRIAVFHHGGCEINQAECDAAIELTAEAVNALPSLLDHIDALETRVAEAERQRDEAVEALKVAQDALGRCHCQFDFYSREHLKQGKVEKARTNELFADVCRDALATVSNIPRKELR